MRISLIKEDPGYHPKAGTVTAHARILINGKDAQELGLRIVTLDTDTGEVVHELLDKNGRNVILNDALVYTTSYFDSVQIIGIAQDR